MQENLDVLIVAFAAFVVGSVIGAFVLTFFGSRRGGPPPEQGD